MYAVFGAAGTSFLLGVVEITTALLLIGAPRFPRAGIVGGAVAAVTFLTTTSLLFAIPIWEPAAGGFPALNGGRPAGSHASQAPESAAIPQATDEPCGVLNVCDGR